MSNTLDQVNAIDATVDRLQKELQAAQKQQRDLHNQALKETCPFFETPWRERFVPLGPTRALMGPTITMRPPHVEGGKPHWHAEGQEVRFRLGNPEKVRHSSIDQPAFEALSADVQALTFDDMTAASIEKGITGENKALKLTERQLKMFSMIATMPMMGQKPFLLEGVKGGQPLPGGATWDGSAVTTNLIWTALVKRGVFDIVDAYGSYQHWRVNPGPRFEEAVNLLLESDLFPRDSIAYRDVLAFFRPGQEAPKSAPKRLRR